MTLTLAIPFYANTELLAAALTSVLAQDVRRLGSRGRRRRRTRTRRGELVERVSALGRFRYLRNPANLGLAGNWNRCLEVARDRAGHDLPRRRRAAARLRSRGARRRTAGDRRRGRGVHRRVGDRSDRQGDLLVPRRSEAVHAAARRRRPHRRGRRGGTRVAVARPAHLLPVAGVPSARGSRNPAFDARWRQVTDLDLLARLLVARRARRRHAPRPRTATAVTVRTRPRCSPRRSTASTRSSRSTPRSRRGAALVAGRAPPTRRTRGEGATARRRTRRCGARCAGDLRQARACLALTRGPCAGRGSLRLDSRRCPPARSRR